MLDRVLIEGGGESYRALMFATSFFLRPPPPVFGGRELPGQENPALYTSTDFYFFGFFAAPFSIAWVLCGGSRGPIVTGKLVSRAIFGKKNYRKLVYLGGKRGAHSYTAAGAEQDSRPANGALEFELSPTPPPFLWDNSSRRWFRGGEEAKRGTASGGRWRAQRKPLTMAS